MGQSTTKRWKTLARYGSAFLAVGIALAARWALIPFWGPTELPFVSFFGAVILVAWLARLGPALLTLALSVLVAVWFFIPPLGTLVAMPGDVTRLAAFVFSSLVAVTAIETIHRANARAVAELTERRRSETELAASGRRQETLYRFVDGIQRAKTLAALYDAALDAIVDALRCDRASILLFDSEGVMRFVGWRGLSDSYRNAVVGHSPWSPDARDPTTLRIEDVSDAEMDESLRTTVQREGIGALAFVPLVVDTKLIGKFMTYYDRPHVWSDEELDLAMAISRQLAFGIARKRDEHKLTEQAITLQASELRLEQALAAGRMGAWEWNVRTGQVIWSPGLERMHGLEPGSFGGTFEEFQRDMHPEDMANAVGRIREAIERRTDYHVTYRIRRPDGATRWVEAFGRLTLSAEGEPERLGGVCMDITDRRRAEAESAELLEREHQLRQAAEEANRVKDEFLATLSHELRNPLNAILGYSELLLRRCEAEAFRELRPIGEALKRNSLIQSNLIQDLLDLSRLRSGKVELKVEPFDVVGATNNAVQTVRAQATAKDITIDIEAPADGLFARGDVMRFEQVAWNLLNNAVKFTPPGGRITIRLRLEEPDAVFVVEDTGQGIEPGFLPHIFEMFRQADPSTTRAHTGMGIGLALVRQLVELQGGSVSAASAGRGRGARFSVRLRASLDEKPVVMAIPRAVQRSLDGMRVLVVDDSEDTADMLRRFLESDGAIVATANGGPQALALAREAPWSVILSDISMPEMDGFEFLKRLRVQPGGDTVPVLALTGYGQQKDIERAHAVGFLSHMTKPVDLDKLLQLLRDIRASEDSRRAITNLPTASPS